MNEVEEFMMICEEGEQVVNGNPLPSDVPQQEFEMIRVELNSLSAKSLLAGEKLVATYSISR